MSLPPGSPSLLPASPAGNGHGTPTQREVCRERWVTL